MTSYEQFLQSKVRLAKPEGLPVEAGAINGKLKPHQKACVEWLVKGGRRALFASFGLGKSVMQMEAVYDYENHVRIAEAIDAEGKLPVTFMLLQPQSWSDEVWADVTRMLTLNGTQWSRGKEMHLCPMQFDIADRCIQQFTEPGELVLDPFAGLGTVPYRAILKGRRGLGFELNPAYFLDAVSYCQAAEAEVSMPSLFDLDALTQKQAA